MYSNALRNDLMSSNEYVRGSTLRLLSKIKQFKVLEPLIEAVLKNLVRSVTHASSLLFPLSLRLLMKRKLRPAGESRKLHALIFLC